MRRWAALVLGFWLGWHAVASVAAERLVRVQVLSKYGWREAQVTAEGLRVEFGDASRHGDLLSGSVARLKAEGDQVDLSGYGTYRRLEFRTPNVPLVVQGEGISRSFTGRLRVEARNGLLRFVEILPVEAYVRSVLAGELPPDFPIEAQKAQAVLIRSFARSQLGRHAAEGFDFCDLTHCQVYGGLDSSDSGLRDEAARTTRSLVLSYQGKPVEGLFHSTCGGHTSPNQKVFGGQPLPYLQGVDDGDYCAASPHLQWSSRIPLDKLSAALAGEERLRESIPVRTVAPEDREPSGRVFTMAVTGPRRAEIPTMDFLSRVGKAFGWNRVKSNWFDVAVNGGGAEFKGRGLGHGVGMCQWGARGMALSGRRFDEILRHYFPGARLSRAP